MGPAFVENLPVRKFHGVGPATARKMSGLGIETGLHLKGQTLEFLQRHFGKAGSYYYWAARGVDERPVRADRIRKSVGAENTFLVDLLTYEAARDALQEIIDKVWSYCEGSGIRGRTVTLKVKFANFQQITRSRTGQMQIRTRSELEQLSNALLEPLFPVARGVRLLGVSLSSLAEESEGSACPFRLVVVSRDRSWAATMSYTELGGLVLGTGLVAAFTCALLHRIVHRDRFRRYHEVGYAVFLQLGVIFAVLLLSFSTAFGPITTPLRRRLTANAPACTG